MTKEDRKYSEPVECGHCFNIAPMEQLYHYWEYMNGEPHCHEILICPSCKKMVIRNYIWAEDYSDPTDVERLFKIAKNLKDIRNIGAHPDLSELTHEEVPIIENLCRELLEYVYSASYLAKIAEEKLAIIKNRKTVHGTTEAPKGTT